MKMGEERQHCCVQFGGRKLKSVEVVKYLGVIISGDGRMEEEIRSKIGKAAIAIGVLNELVWQELSRRTKLCVQSVQCYCSAHTAVCK